jgi:Spy/CpxP family protein refolding chaperone
MLGAESIQKELELSDEQKKKLREIAEQYRRQVQESWRAEDWETFRKLPPEEQKKQLVAQREKTAKRRAEVAADTRAKIEALLLPHQVQRFEEIVFRARASVMLYNPRTLERLGVTDDQKERLRKVRDEFQEKTQKLQQEAIDKTLSVLSPEQKAKLKEMTSEGFGFPGGPR